MNLRLATLIATIVVVLHRVDRHVGTKLDEAALLSDAACRIIHFL